MKTRLAAIIVALSLLSLIGTTAAVAQDPEADTGEVADEQAIEFGGVGLLTPGRYMDDSLGMQISFSLGEGWFAESPLGAVGVVMQRNEPGEPYFDLHRFAGKFQAQPCRTEGDDTYFQDFDLVDTTAEAFMERLGDNPYLMREEPVAIEVDGYSGLWVDLTTELDERCDFDPRTYLWSMNPDTATGYMLADDTPARIIALDVDGQVIVAVMETLPDADFPAYMDVAMAVIDSMTFAASRQE